MKTIKTFVAILLLGCAFASESYAMENMSSFVEISYGKPKKKVTAEEKLEKKITEKVEAVAAELNLNEEEKAFLKDNWIAAEKERAAISKEGKDPEVLKAERGAVNKKYNKLLTKRFGKERTRQINAAAKEYQKSLRETK